MPAATLTDTSPVLTLATETPTVGVQPPQGLGQLFPSVIPQPEQIIYQAVRDACNARVTFPPDGQALALPLAFSQPAELDNRGQPIPVVRGWPAYPGQIPAIGVAESTTNEDPTGELVQAGFAGDAYAYDAGGNVIATCSYYAEALHVTVVVELIHTNRDERDRLHDALRRVIYPLRSILPGASSQIRDVKIAAEKQDLPVDEQPVVMYVSIYTVEVIAEALIATEIVPDGVITAITVTPTYLPAPWPYPEAPVDPT